MKTTRSGYAVVPGSASLPRAATTRLVPRARQPIGAVLDALAPTLEAEELAVYLQVWREAGKNGVDGCRLSRAQLCERTRLSDLRLGKALAGLVEKRALELLDRNRAGTLYRLPMGAAPAAAPPSARRVAVPSVGSIGDVARAFLEAGGSARGLEVDDVLQHVLGLVEEGHALATIHEALTRFLAEAPPRASLVQVARFLP